MTDLPIKVQKFDSALGTLVSTTFELTATMNTQAYATNDGGFYAGWDKLTYEFSLSGSGSYEGAMIDASHDPIRIVGSGSPDGTFSFGPTFPGEYESITTPWSQAGPELTKTESFSFGASEDFIGEGGFLNFYLNTVNLDTISSSGQGVLGLETDIFAQVTATYNYNPVPIPGAALLLASGLLCLTGMRKRSQR